MTDATRYLSLGSLRWLLAAMGLCTLPLVIDLPPWETAAIVAAAWWRYDRTRRGVGQVSWRILIPVMPLIVVGLMASGAIGVGLSLATPAFIAGCWMKLLEMSNARDYQLCCFLCFLILAVILYDQQSIIICIYGIGALAVVVLAIARNQVVSAAAVAARARTRRILFQAAPLAGVVFLLMPRLQINMPNVGGEGISGFTDSMRPGDIARMATSDKIVFRAEFPEAQLPAGSELYWRGLVMNESDDGALWRVNQSQNDRDQRLTWAGSAGLPVIVQDITLMPNGQPWLFALQDAVAVDVSEGDRSTDLRRNATVHYYQQVNHVLRYSLSSRLGDRAMDRDPRSGIAPIHVNRQVAELAAQLKAGTTNADQAAERILDYYHANGFSYSLSPGRMGDELHEFLFERKRGFCAHYATAFAALMRLMGHPARVVIGYHGGEVNTIGGFVVVRQEHAHAWAEIQEPDHSWKHVDPTFGIPVAPGEDLPAAQQPGSALSLVADRSPAWIPSWLRTPYQATNQWWQFAEARWDGWFMGFDAEHQAGLLARLGLGRPGPLTLFGLLAAAALVAVLILKRFVRPRPPRDALRDLYERWCARVAAGGVVKERWEGPVAFAERASARWPEQQEALTEAAWLYARLRYAPAGRDREAGMRRLAALTHALAVRPGPAVGVPAPSVTTA